MSIVSTYKKHQEIRIERKKKKGRIINQVAHWTERAEWETESERAVLREPRAVTGEMQDHDMDLANAVRYIQT